MKNMLLKLVVIFVALAGCPGVHASNGTRFTFDPHNLNHAVIEVDVVEECNHEKECSVEVLPGLSLKIRSTIDATVPFSQRNDYSASGLVSQHVLDAELPANPCIDSPFPITSFLLRPAFGNRDKSPSGWQPESGRFTGVSRSGFSIMEVPDSPVHFCIEPRGRFDSDKKRRPLFAVLSLRLVADLSKTVTGVVFANSMTRVTPILADRVEDAINDARNLEDDNELLELNAKPHLRLLISALVGLRIALNPPNSGNGAAYPSSADEGIRRAVHVAVRAWGYAAPHFQAITGLEPPGCRGAQKDPAIRQYCDRLLAFKSSIAWLNLDLDTIRSVYGESVTRNFGKSQFVVPLAELLLAELERLRATAAGATPKAVPSKDVLEWLAGIQELLIELREGAFQSGDEAPEISGVCLPRLAMRWNSASSQKLIEALWASEGKEDLRVLLAFVDTLKKLPAAETVEFKNLGLIRGASPLGNGGAVRCSVDKEGGEYCVVDLLTACEGRLACSTKLPFGGHAVYVSTRVGTMSAPQPLGTWVRGEEIPVVQRGALLPANPEVCSDVPIVSVLYRPSNPTRRWTRDAGGVIGGSTESQPDRATVYPPNNNHTFSSRCVVFETKGDEEGAYLIQAVRVKVNLDKERDSLMRTLMVNASHQLKQDLEVGLRSAKVFQSLLHDQSPAIDEYSRAIAALIAELDRSAFHYVNRPVTLPDVRASAANLYVRANVLLSNSAGHELDAQGFMTGLRQLVAQLSLGFGFNSTIHSPAEATRENPLPKRKRDEAIKQVRDLIAGTRVYETVLPDEYHGALREYIDALTATCKAAEATTKRKAGYEGYPYLADPAVKTEAALSVGYAGTLIGLLRSHPEINKEIIEKFSNDQSRIAETFLLNDAGPDLSHKRAAAIDVLNFAVEEGTRYIGMKWSDPPYGAASRMQWLLRDEVVPAARGPKGDDTVARLFPKLRSLWEDAEFQLFLKRVGKPSPKAEAVVNQMEKTLGLHLPNLSLIMPAQ